MRVCTEGPRWLSGRAPVLQHRTRRWLLYRRLRAIHGRVVAARSYYRVANPVIYRSHLQNLCGKGGDTGEIRRVLTLVAPDKSI